MANSIVRGTDKQLVQAVVYGLATLLLYSLLYLFEEPLLSLSSHGRWYFIFPVTIAFVFSFAHGAFTGRFWDVLGIKAKK